MKKILSYGMILCLLLLAECGINSKETETEETEKKCKIEVQAAEEDTLLQTIEDQNTVNELLDMEQWEEAESLPEDLTPEYKLVVYQEETILLGQDPDEERDYEIIETLITYEDSPYVTEIISSDVIKNMEISEEYLTFNYIMPDEEVDALHNIVN